MRNRLYLSNAEDREAVLLSLARNFYVVKIGREKADGKSNYTYLQLLR